MLYEDSSLDIYAKAALGKKAFDLVALDVRELTSVADIFMICSGRSSRQVAAIAEHIQYELKQLGIRPISADGVKEGHWALLDYGHVIIHVFYDSDRRFYDLEGLWTDAPRVKTQSMMDEEQKASETLPPDGEPDEDE